MEPQRERLPPWVSTYLDDMKACGELDPITMYTLMLYGDRRFCAERAEAFNTRLGRGENFAGLRSRLVDELTAYADELMPYVPATVWPGLLRSAVLDFNTTIRETAEWLCGWAVEDACEGGATLPFRRPPRSGLQRSWWPTERVKRRLFSPRHMRTYMRKIKEVERFRLTAQRMMRLTTDERIGTYEEELHFFELLEGQANSTLPEPDSRRALLAWAEDQKLIKIVKGRKKKLLARVRRKRLSRAATFATSLLGAKKVNAFIRGEYIPIRGRDVTFLVGRQTDRLEQCGHGCLSLAAKATEGDVSLGVFCFYIEGTPVLDQLTAIALHTEAGTEREIIAISNVILAASAGANHPFMVERRAAEMAALIQEPLPRNLADRDPNGFAQLRRPGYDARQLWEERRAWYWQETGEQWQNILRVMIFGRHARQWNSICLPPRPPAQDVVLEEHAPVPLDLVA